MNTTEGIFRSYVENKTREFLRTLNVDPIRMSVEIDKFVDSVLDKLVELFRDDLERYGVGEIDCETLSDVINAIDEMHDELSYNCEALEDKLDSIEDYVARMRKQLKGMDFEGKGEIEAILSDIEGEL